MSGEVEWIGTVLAPFEDRRPYGTTGARDERFRGGLRQPERARVRPRASCTAAAARASRRSGSRIRRPQPGAQRHRRGRLGRAHQLYPIRCCLVFSPPVTACGSGTGSLRTLDIEEVLPNSASSVPKRPATGSLYRNMKLSLSENSASGHFVLRGRMAPGLRGSSPEAARGPPTGGRMPRSKSQP
jgi:hypothetical protein